MDSIEFLLFSILVLLSLSKAEQLNQLAQYFFHTLVSQGLR